jgi:hypothetical protein
MTRRQRLNGRFPPMSKMTSQRAAAGEVFGGVIDNLVGANGADEVDASGTGHGGHVRAEPFRDLHGKGYDAAAGTVDEHALSGANPRPVAQPKQRREPGDVERRRLLEGDARRLRRQSLLGGHGEFGEAAVRPSQHLGPRLEQRDVLSDRQHAAGEIDAADAVLRRPDGLEEWNEERHAPRQVPVQRVHRRRVHLHEHSVVAGAWRLDFAQLEHVGRAIALLHDRGDSQSTTPGTHSHGHVRVGADRRRPGGRWFRAGSVSRRTTPASRSNRSHSPIDSHPSASAFFWSTGSSHRESRMSSRKDASDYSDQRCCGLARAIYSHAPAIV